MQKINLIAQSVLKLSHCEKVHDDDDDDDDTHPGWIIVRVGMYSVADKKVGYVSGTIFYAKSNDASFKVRKLTVFKQWSFEVIEYAN